MSEQGDLRLYNEKCDNSTWDTIAQTKPQLQQILQNLKEEKLYKQEVERILKEKEEEKNRNDVDLWENLKETSEKVEARLSGYSCQICSLVTKTRFQLMEHYSSLHLLRQLKDKFPHLVEGNVCKFCKFDAIHDDNKSENEKDDSETNQNDEPTEDENEDLIWIHIGAIHEKINIILRVSVKLWCNLLFRWKISFNSTYRVLVINCIVL